MVVVTFPLRSADAVDRLLEGYDKTHRFKHERSEAGEEASITDVPEGEGKKTRWLLLGSTGMWKGSGWNDETSSYDESNERAIAEDRLLAQRGEVAVVLDLAGLWGGQRHPSNWIERVAKTKEEVKGKGALHLAHGEDVAKAIVASWEMWEKVRGKRWIICDGWSYDWWGLFVRFATEEQVRYKRWVYELMNEEGVRSLPREHKDLGRLMDGRAFWGAVGEVPSTSLI